MAISIKKKQIGTFLVFLLTFQFYFDFLQLLLKLIFVIAIVFSILLFLPEFQKPSTQQFRLFELCIDSSNLEVR
jgi:hypothetical protein